MNKIKVEKVVDIFCDNLNIINIRYRNIIKELMINIIAKYENCGITEVEDKQQYLIKNDNDKYSIEDFFLNRLLFNVTNFEIKTTGGRAEYNESSKSIIINKNKLETLLDKYTTISFTEEQKFLAAKKVVMHEFEHALQTQFDYGPVLGPMSEKYKYLYNKLFNANLGLKLNEIYDGRSLFPYQGNGNRTQSGLKGHARNEDKYKKYVGTLPFGKSNTQNDTENNVNEIFNESESLLMSGSDEHQKEIFPSGNIINVKNKESSNFLITNYGFMLKLLLGEERTFEGMYLDRNKIIDYFNEQFEQIFRNVFEEHFIRQYPNINIIDGWSILHLVIGETKYTYEYGNKSLSDLLHSKLNYAFALCFEKVIKSNIEKGMSFNSCKNMWEEFKSLSLYNRNPEQTKLLPHVKVLNTLREYIKYKFKLENNYEIPDSIHRTK